MLRLLVILVIIAGWMPISASAQSSTQSSKLYRWVDERGVVTYSDRRPADPNVADGVSQVSRTISVYTPDKTLLQAVEAARVQSSRPAGPVASYAPPSYAPAAAPTPLLNDPCAQMDCAEYSGSAYPFPGVLPVRRHGPHLIQAVLPAGATAGTVNSPGIIPGQTGANYFSPGPFNNRPGGKVTRPLGALEPAR
jgi:hypothetical protein